MKPVPTMSMVASKDDLIKLLYEHISRQELALEKCKEQRNQGIEALRPTTFNRHWPAWCKQQCDKEIDAILEGSDAK